eukprot:TRINITY_DN13519_c0_g1_i1.p1 TRINITY_DN13519_c0_g1~~TRINITY_DN13519_c0_g1_i1.p1  ORF type:complete len:263 (-),score=33.62 TRINITY_DN13519_c0_g1_i1:118-906(-)
MDSLVAKRALLTQVHTYFNDFFMNSRLLNLCRSKITTNTVIPSNWKLTRLLFDNVSLRALDKVRQKLMQSISFRKKVKFMAIWEYYPDDINVIMPNLKDIFEDVWNIIEFDFSVKGTNFDDVGCIELAQTLQFPSQILKMRLSFSGTKITDVGLSKIVLQLPQHPLCHVWLFLENTAVTDKGISNLIDVLSVLPNLFNLMLVLEDCPGITDRSAEKLAGLIADNILIHRLELTLRRTGITQDGAKLILATKAFWHARFIVIH